MLRKNNVDFRVSKVAGKRSESMCLAKELTVCKAGNSLANSSRLVGYWRWWLVPWSLQRSNGSDWWCHCVGFWRTSGRWNFNLFRFECVGFDCLKRWDRLNLDVFLCFWRHTHHRRSYGGFYLPGWFPYGLYFGFCCVHLIQLDIFQIQCLHRLSYLHLIVWLILLFLQWRRYF